MAKRTKKAPADGATINIVTGAAGENAVTEEEFEDLDALEDGALTNALDDMRRQEGVLVEVYRLMPADKAGLCRTYPVSLFSSEIVAKEWGPGKYRVRFKGPDKKFIKGGGVFDVAEPNFPHIAPPPAAATGVTDLLALLKADRERSKDEWFKWATLLAPILGPKLIDAFSQKGPTLKDLMEMMVRAKELQAPAAPASDVTDQLEKISKVMLLVREMGGENDRGASWPDLILKGLEKAPEVLQGLRGGIPLIAPPSPATAPMGPALSPPGKAAAATPPAPLTAGDSAPSSAGVSAAQDANGGSDMNLRLLPWLKGTLEQLLVQAARNRDPALYAEVTVDNLPDYVPPQTLAGFIGRADWWQVVSGFDARVQPYYGWFNQYREEVLALLKDLVPPAEAAPQVPAHPAQEPGEGEFT